MGLLLQTLFLLKNFIVILENAREQSEASCELICLSN